MIITKEIKQELLAYLDKLPVYLWLEVLNFIKYLLFREQLLEQTSIEQSTIVEDDPLLQLVGLGSSDIHDLSIRHDDYLAELELGDQHAP